MKIKTKDLQVKAIQSHIPRNFPFKLASVLTGRRLFADNAEGTQGNSSFSKVKLPP